MLTRASIDQPGRQLCAGARDTKEASPGDTVRGDCLKHGVPRIGRHVAGCRVMATRHATRISDPQLQVATSAVPAKLTLWAPTIGLRCHFTRSSAGRHPQSRIKVQGPVPGPRRPSR